MILRCILIVFVSFVHPSSDSGHKTEGIKMKSKVLVENQQVLTPQFVYSKIHEWKDSEMAIVLAENEDKFTSFTYVNDSAFADGLDIFRYEIGASNNLPTLTFYSNKNSVIGEEVTSIYTIHRFDGEKFYGVDSVIFLGFSNGQINGDRDTSIFCARD